MERSPACLLMRPPLGCVATRTISRFSASGIHQTKTKPIRIGSFFAAMQPFNAGEVYVNSLDQGEGHRVREAYGINYDRLVALKAKFDPTNFFRCNQNIPPR